MNKFRVFDRQYNRYINETKDFFLSDEGKLFSLQMPDLNDMYECDTDRYIVEFFTGMTVNGVDIYEGDICKVHQFTMELGASLGVYEGEREFIAVVKFSEFGVSFNDELYSDLNFEDIDEQIEVLGSIHTHKHLLEGE